MSTVPQVNNEAEYQTITSSSNFSVIYFYSTQCGYCDLMTPVVEETANCYATGMLKFYRVNGQDSWPGVQRLTTRLKINAYPQVWVFRDNKVCARQPGYIIYPRFEEWLSFHTSCNKNGFAVRACTVNIVDSGNEANENSPLRIRGNSTESNEADTSYKKELFAIWAIQSAPYFGPLLAFLKRIATAKADDADFLLLIMDQEDGEVEDYFLKYRPHAQFFLGEDQFFTYHFLSGDLTERFSKWVEDCLTAIRIMEPDDEVEESEDNGGEDEKELEKPVIGNGELVAESEDSEPTIEIEEPVIGNDVEDEDIVVEVSSKGVLYEEIIRGGTSVVLFHDSTPLSQAMVTVQKRTANRLHHRGTQLFRVNFQLNDAFTGPLNLPAGPTTIVFRDGLQVGEKSGIMLEVDLEKWVEHSLLRRNKLPFLAASSKMEQKSIQSLSPTGLLDVTSPASRPSSRASSRWDVASDAERLHNRQKCLGGHEDRARRNILARLLTKSKPFLDIERGCVIVPSDAHEGLQLGRASEEGSYFNLALRLSPDNPLKIEFRVEFGTDPTVSLKSRFKSATLTADFGYDDEHGQSHFLRLHEVQPRELKGESTVAQLDMGTETSLSLGVGYQAASITTEGKLSHNASYSRTTEQVVRGHGEMTHTAHWTFVEDETGKHGLRSQYDLSVVLGRAEIPLGEIWIAFWGKAMLKLPGGEEKLRLGSKEEPHKRTLLVDIDMINN